MTATTANLPAERKPQVVAGAPVAALVPKTLEEAFRLAGAIAQSGLAPRGIDKPEQIMVAIMAGAELGLAPFQALQSFAVVNGRPTLWGDGLMAVARAQGVRAREWIDGAGDDMVAHCEITRPDSGEVVERQFSVADAKKAGLWGKQGPWQQYPKRMLQMRARAWALRDGCADMLRGFQVREEVEDFEPAPRGAQAAAATGMRARLEARQNAAGGFDPGNVAREIDAVSDVIEGEFEEASGATTFTNEEAEAGAQAAQEAQEDVFPGDRAQTAAQPNKSAQDGPSAVLEGMRTGRDLLNDQTADEPLTADTEASCQKLEARLEAADSMDALDEIWAGAQRLRDFLKGAHRKRLNSIQGLYNGRLEALS